MRDKPVLINRIPREASADLIIDTSHSNFFQGEHKVLERFTVLRHVMVSKEPAPYGRHNKLGRLLQATPCLVKGWSQLPKSFFELLFQFPRNRIFFKPPDILS